VSWMLLGRVGAFDLWIMCIQQSFWHRLL
jgi:hypothetical protein